MRGRSTGEWERLRACDQLDEAVGVHYVGEDRRHAHQRRIVLFIAERRIRVGEEMTL